jgi:hypothetical protein
MDQLLLLGRKGLEQAGCVATGADDGARESRREGLPCRSSWCPFV